MPSLNVGGYHMPKYAHFFCSVFAIFLFADSVSAQTRYWTPVWTHSSGQYMWEHPGNWEVYGGLVNYPGPPTANDWAYIYGQHGTIGVFSNATVKGIWLGSYNYLGTYPSVAASATFDLHGLTLTASDGIYLGRTNSSSGNLGANLGVVNGTLATGGNVYADHNSVITVQNGGMACPIKNVPLVLPEICHN